MRVISLGQSYSTPRYNLKQDSLEADTKSDATGTQKQQNDASKLQLTKLKARDTEVRAHEAAHKAAGGALAGSASFTYERGPDGKMYAIGGEVPINFSEGSTQQETIANARIIKAAALAPANPSPQDYAVANSAMMMELKAKQQLIKELTQELQGVKAYTKESSYDSLAQKSVPPM